MTENIRITAGNKLIGPGVNSYRDSKVVRLELDVLDEKLNFCIVVGQVQARLADIVPLARSICSNIINVVLKKIRSRGEYIPCYKGCSTCCYRCLVPVSVPEAFRLKEEIEKEPAYKRQSIWEDCLNASRHILTHKPPKKFVHKSAESSSNKPANLVLISNWYSSLKLACPFLNQDICTIYQKRPLVCREHFIIGSAEGCEEDDYSAEVVEMPIQVPNALGQLASELEDTNVEAVILPLTLVWCKENKERAARTWPYSMMVERFVEIIKAMAVKNSEVATV